MWIRLGKTLTALALVAATLVAALAIWRVIRSQVEVDVYRQRLTVLEAEYEALRDRYDRAVRETAVTELWVEQGRLAVVLRNAEGVVRRIETDFDPAREIYVDFVVREGRLWIRRVFDQATPPDAGLRIDPALADLDWHEEAEDAHGKATYRALEEGRWTVTVTGGGALGLARASEPPQPLFAGAPAVTRFAPVEQEVAAALSAIGPRELGDALWRRALRLAGAGVSTGGVP